MLVRVFVVSNSLFYYICFLIGSSWKEYVVHCFVLIQVRTSVYYKLH